MRTITIGEQDWTIRVTPLRIRAQGRSYTSLVDYNSQDILVTSVDGPEAMARSVAQAVAEIARRAMAA